jgi:hypothetical protein
VHLYLALLETTVPAEIHVDEKGGHGFGLKQGNTLPGMTDWKARAIDWLRGRVGGGEALDRVAALERGDETVTGTRSSRNVRTISPRPAPPGKDGL